MTVDWTPGASRYQTMKYNRCGRSGLMLSSISLGLWHNFGGVDAFESMRALLCTAFDLGVTHFDLANNYGPPPGSAEENLGRMLKTDFSVHRDELIISTKAGFRMWPGPYGDGGSRKYLLASLDQSLQRLGIDYVDIFYHHCPDPDTPLEETMAALDHAVRAGKAQYVGISSYSPEQTLAASRILNELGTPCLIHQPVYNMLNRWIEDGLMEVLDSEGIGCIPFCPLAQGLLTNRYLEGIPQGSRAAKSHGFLKDSHVTEDVLGKVRALSVIAERRGQTMAQMAVAWILRLSGVTSVLIGASRPDQIRDCVGALENDDLSSEELAEIDEILGSKPK